MEDNTNATVPGMTDQTLLDAVNVAINKIQEAAALHTDTLDKLARHNVDEVAHADIREQLTAMQGETGFVTPDKATVMIAAAIADHNIDAKAHAVLMEKVQILEDTIASLEKRITELEPTDSSGDDELSALELRLAAIDAEYDPIIAGVKSAWEAAMIQGKTETAAALAEEYNKVVEEKNLAIQEAMKEYTYAE